jgi:hypothetical protein
VVVRVFEEFEEQVLERELAVGDVACVVDEGCVWIRDGDGDLEQMAAGYHTDFVADGSVYAWHPDEGTADDATRAGDLGHIGNVYFVFWYEDWMWLGPASSADEALDHLRGRLGVLDDSWVRLEG